MEIKRSGSREKGTAIKGKSDMDMFVSISDTNGYFMLRELYDDLYDYFEYLGIIAAERGNEDTATDVSPFCRAGCGDFLHGFGGMF